MKKQKENKKLKVALYALGIWWTLAIILLIFQSLIMLRSPFILIAIIFIPLPIYLHLKLYKNLQKHKKSAIIIFYIYALTHFIPLALQLIGIKEAGIDNILVALIGLSLIYSKN